MISFMKHVSYNLIRIHYNNQEFSTEVPADIKTFVGKLNIQFVLVYYS